MDCANTAVAVTDGANDLQQAVSQAGNSPQDAQKALDQIEQNLKKIGDRTDNADLGKAIDSMNTAVKNVRTSLENGNTAPDIKPVADAASELTKVCTSG
jgi:predicted  nucleic acid-binding Zn-ribbon protein